MSCLRRMRRGIPSESGLGVEGVKTELWVMANLWPMKDKCMSTSRPMLEEDRAVQVNSVFQVADLTRPLMSASQICDDGYKCGFERAQAMVVTPEDGVLWRFDQQSGLYVSKIHLK